MFSGRTVWIADWRPAKVGEDRRIGHEALGSSSSCRPAGSDCPTSWTDASWRADTSWASWAAEASTWPGPALPTCSGWTASSSSALPPPRSGTGADCQGSPIRAATCRASNSVEPLTGPVDSKKLQRDSTTKWTERFVFYRLHNHSALIGHHARRERLSRGGRKVPGGRAVHLKGQHFSLQQLYQSWKGFLLYHRWAGRPPRIAGRRLMLKTWARVARMGGPIWTGDAAGSVPQTHSFIFPVRIANRIMGGHLSNDR